METKDNDEIYQAAKKLVEEGCSVVPIKKGSKSPDGIIKWTPYQTRVPTEQEITKWFSHTNHQLGLVTGCVSRGRFILDFDGPNYVDAFLDFLDSFPEFESGAIVRSGSGKFHLHGICDNIPVDVTMIKKHLDSATIELRANLVQTLIPPSQHPNGGFYEYESRNENPTPVTRERFMEVVTYINDGKTTVHSHSDVPPCDIPSDQKLTSADWYKRWVIRKVLFKGESRNDKGYELARYLNDLQLPIEEAGKIMIDYAEDVGMVRNKDHEYTYEEAEGSLDSAYHNTPRPPFVPHSMQPNESEAETPVVEVIDETIVVNEDLNVGQLNLIYPRDTFRGLIKECADVYSTYLESPYEFWVFNWATIIGSMYAQKVLIPSQLKTQPRLYCVLIGTSGKTRKSESKKQSIEIIRDLLWECEGSQRDEKNKKIYSKYLTYKDGMGSAEGLMRRLKVTPNMILCFDEFRSFVQKSDIKGSNLLQAVTSLFEDTFLENPVKIGSDFDRVDDCALSLLACCTSKTWETLFSASFINIGLPNRLWLVPAEANRKSFTPNSVPEKELIRLRFRFFKMLEKFPLDVSTPYLIDWEGGRYGDAYQRIEDWYMKMPDNDFTTRVDTYGRKFLMIMAISEGKDVITLEMVERIIPLLDWQMQVREAYQPEEFTNLMSKIESAIRRVVKRNPGITQGRMFSQFRELGGQKDKELAVQGMVRSDEIIQKNVIPLTGGKHTIRYFYNPKWKIENE